MANASHLAHYHSNMAALIQLGNWFDYLKENNVYYPLLMVKDFRSTEFTTSDEFMTNADVPTLVIKHCVR